MALGAAVTGSVYLSARSSGSYFTTAWPLLGTAVVLAALGLLLIGKRPGRRVSLAAGALAAYGAWSLASVLWGGIPDVAWVTFDQALVGAAALVLGSLLVGVVSAQLVVGGVLAGLTLEALELLYRLQAGPAPADWFYGRKVQGPVGYANAQAAIVAVGVPLALWLAADRRIVVRVAAGAASGVLMGALLVTQSRGALLALALALLVQVALSRDVRTLGLVLVLALYTAALWQPLQHVDNALVDGGSGAQVDAFRHYVVIAAAAAAVLAGVAAIPPTLAAARRSVGLALVGVLVAGTAAFAIVRPSPLRDLRLALDGTLSTAEPASLPGGDTRFASGSLTGRAAIWRVALRLYTDHPVVGAGKGEFARAYDLRRTNPNLSVLQPHSIELEVLSELGVPGAAFFLLFVVSACFALVRRRVPGRAGRAAGIAALAVLMLQASVDWTFSFPALVVAVLLAVGAFAGAGRPRTTTLAVYAGLVVAVVAVLVSFAGPYLGARTLAQARNALPGDPARAWDLASRARGYDHWNADVVALQGRIAETSGKTLLAATLYARAAELAPHRWSYQLDQARMLYRAGLNARGRAVCLTAWAEDPLEHGLGEGVCADFGP